MLVPGILDLAVPDAAAAQSFLKQVSRIKNHKEPEEASKDGDDDG